MVNKSASLPVMGLLLVFVGCCLYQLAAGQEPEGQKAVLKAAERLLPYFADDPGTDLTKHFTSTFLKAIAAAQVDLPKIFRDLYGKHGRAESVRLVRMLKPYRAEVEFVFEKQVVVPTLIEVEAEPPHHISTLFFRGAQRDQEDWETLRREFQRLPGRVGLCCLRLEPEPTQLLEYQAEEVLAVGSLFKLVVLSAVAEEIQAGNRHWQDVEKLRKSWASLPSGLLHDWPDGAPVTWFTLTALMVSQSDNTAADHLIQLLGRERIEQQQRRLGVRHPERNQPFLTTAELFKLKLVLSAPEQEAYVRGNASQRRQLLETTVKSATLERSRPLGEPQRIEEIEWFYSAADVCRILDGLRRQSRAVPEVLDLLAINPGLPVNRRYWEYVGYKGGAEPGVLAYALLLRNRAGHWFAFAISWNHPREALETAQLHTLALRLLRYVEQTYPLSGK